MNDECVTRWDAHDGAGSEATELPWITGSADRYSEAGWRRAEDRSSTAGRIQGGRWFHRLPERSQ